MCVCVFCAQVYACTNTTRVHAHTQQERASNLNFFIFQSWNLKTIKGNLPYLKRFPRKITFVLCFVGLGILSSPFAVAKAGWMGAIISITVSSTYAYTAYLMAKCVEYDATCSNYQDIAKLTLGKRMRKVITALFYMELTGTLVGYCISMGDNLNYIFPHLGFSVPGLSSRNFMICVVSLIILPSVWLRDLSALSFTSMWCIASSLLLLVAVLLAATINHIGFHHPLPFLNIKGVPIAAGLYAFSYGGTSVFPSIYKSMKDPSKFTQVYCFFFFISILLTMSTITTTRKRRRKKFL